MARVGHFFSFLPQSNMAVVQRRGSMIQTVLVIVAGTLCLSSFSHAALPPINDDIKKATVHFTLSVYKHCLHLAKGSIDGLTACLGNSDTSTSPYGGMAAKTKYFCMKGMPYAQLFNRMQVSQGNLKALTKLDSILTSTCDTRDKCYFDQCQIPLTVFLNVADEIQKLALSLRTQRLDHSFDGTNFQEEMLPLLIFNGFRDYEKLFQSAKKTAQGLEQDSPVTARVDGTKSVLKGFVVSSTKETRASLLHAQFMIFIKLSKKNCDPGLHLDDQMALQLQLQCLKAVRKTIAAWCNDQEGRLCIKHQLLSNVVSILPTTYGSGTTPIRPDQEALLELDHRDFSLKRSRRQGLIAHSSAADSPGAEQRLEITDEDVKKGRAKDGKEKQGLATLQVAILQQCQNKCGCVQSMCRLSDKQFRKMGRSVRRSLSLDFDDADGQEL